MLSTKYSEGEIEEMGDLSKLTTEQFVAAPNRKSLGLNGRGNQKVVQAGEVRGSSSKGGSTCLSSLTGTQSSGCREALPRAAAPCTGACRRPRTWPRPLRK